LSARAALHAPIRYAYAGRTNRAAAEPGVKTLLTAKGPLTLNIAAWRIVLWLVLGGLLAALTALGFKGYLNPDFLIGYATSFMC
jgi:hypothetical protein